MTAYLVTGRSGTGKTALCTELRTRGFTCFDTDRVPNLSGWVNPKTGKPTDVDYTKLIDKSRAEWRWNGKVLRPLLDSPGIVFVCGSADNQLKWHKLFDKVFVLILNADEHRRRIVSRTEHDYGKLPAMQTQIIAEQEVFVSQSVAAGAIPIDASPSIQSVADQILEYI